MKKRYMVLLEVGYGHQEPIFVSASSDKKALEEAYASYLDDEANECLVSDTDPEDLEPPEVYEISLLKPDSKLFLKIGQERAEERKKKWGKQTDARTAALAKLSAEDKKALGLA